MATKNPRVVSYIDPEDYQELKAFMDEHKCTESKAIALILHHYFSKEPISTPASRVTEALASTPSGTPNDEILNRLVALEQQVAALSSTLGNTRELQGKSAA